ncbi:hypothetical protein [uncultured Shewanella sp.]|uniref:hypothetical protein n=1 Tax=uncultured Shewanella sp. TaxID=173975 RepID=UPI00261B9912|nr:hypothetical protein [uncultured Shewanella sp.]
MINRLINTGILRVEKNEHSQKKAFLADKEAILIDKKTAVTIGIVLTPNTANLSLWATQATLLLAASKESHDAAIEYRNDSWMLWHYYDTHHEDEELEQKSIKHLALGRFLENGLID